jgi:transcriptional regulator with XRE-family HTH domain
MESLGELIYNSRKNKNITQEELAELSKVNLRTIQRIENNENKPRESTLKLLFEVLEINNPISKFDQNIVKRNYIELVIEFFFLIIINIALMGVTGWMTLDSEANLNTRFAGFLLSFLIPLLIVFITKSMNKTERLLKFGSGYFIYMVISIFMVGIPTAFVTGLLLCLSISILTIFYGDKLVIKFFFNK